MKISKKFKGCQCPLCLEYNNSNFKELKKIYYKSGIWLKFNWYDFLKEVSIIIKKNVD